MDSGCHLIKWEGYLEIPNITDRKNIIDDKYGDVYEDTDNPEAMPSGLSLFFFVGLRSER